jgi:hypothetical protein
MGTREQEPDINPARMGVSRYRGQIGELTVQGFELVDKSGTPSRSMAQL